MRRGCWLGRGQIVGDRYRVEERIGSGGMGFVVAATDLRTARRVALKLPHLDRLTRARDRARLVREAQAVQRVTSSHVPRILEVGSFRAEGIEVPFLALEYLDGADLAVWLAARGRMSASIAVSVIVQACDAIAEAHALGIVHRDLKPANLFLTSSPAGELVVKVLDFGIARACATSDAKLTTTGALVGSPAYMPPERMRPSSEVDARGDLWSLGVVLYEMVAGHLPFESAVFPDLCLKILLDDVPPLPEDCDVPRGIVDVLKRCLEKEPDARYQTAGELSAALQPFADPAPRISAVELELLAVASRPEVDDEVVVAPRKRYSSRWSIAAALIIVPALAFVPERSREVLIPATTARSGEEAAVVAPQVPAPVPDGAAVQAAPLELAASASAHEPLPVQAQKREGRRKPARLAPPPPPPVAPRAMLVPVPVPVPLASPVAESTAPTTTADPLANPF